MEDKNAARKRMLDMRNSMHKKDIEYYSEIICRRIAGLSRYKEAGTVLLYSSTGSEVMLDMLIKTALRDKKRICFPTCTGRMRMEAYVPEGPESMRTGSFGIREPDPVRSVHVKPEDIDLIVLPCVSFDTERVRLGMGGGYYDRYLLRAVNAFTVQAAFDMQRYTGLLPVNEYDMKTCMVVTEKDIY